MKDKSVCTPNENSRVKIYKKKYKNQVVNALEWITVANLGLRKSIRLLHHHQLTDPHLLIGMELNS